MASPTESARDRAAARIEEVRARFLKGLDERLKGVAELAHAAASADDKTASEAIDALRLALHNLSGAAPTLGLPDLGRAAAGIEKQVIVCRKAAGRLDRETADAIAASVLALSVTPGPR